MRFTVRKNCRWPLLMLHQMLRSFVQCFSLARNTVSGLWNHLIFILTLNFLCKWRATIQHHHIQRLIDFFSWKLICRESKNINKVLNWWPSEQWLRFCIIFNLITQKTKQNKPTNNNTTNISPMWSKKNKFVSVVYIKNICIYKKNNTII